MGGGKGSEGVSSGRAERVPTQENRAGRGMRPPSLKQRGGGALVSQA